MKNIKWELIIAAFLLSCAIIIYGLLNRYFLIAPESGARFKIDKLTGKTYIYMIVDDVPSWVEIQ